MSKHSGKREREARKRNKKRSRICVNKPGSGWQTYKLGHKKFSDALFGNLDKFAGCVVEAER